jgi:hypothetical protein
VTPRTHEEIKPLMMDIRDYWKEGDKLYIDTWMTSLPFTYYQKRFGFHDTEFKVTGLYSFYMLPREENIWFLTSHRFKDEIDAISRYFELSGEKIYSRIAPKTYKKMGGHAAVFHYNLKTGKDKQYFLPGMGRWQGMYHDSWTDGNAFIDGLYFQVKDSYKYLSVALKGYHPFQKSVKDLGLSVFVNDRKIDFVNRSDNTYIFKIESSTNIINSIRIESKTFVPQELNINTDTRRLGVNIDSIMLGNTGYFFYPWEMHNGIIPGIPDNIPVRFRWSKLQSSMDIQDFINNNVKRKLFLKCANPDIQDNPVTVTLSIDGTVIKEIKFTNNQWKTVSLETVNFENKTTLTLQVSRTWRPKAFGISNDGRDLGVAMAIPSIDQR